MRPEHQIEAWTTQLQRDAQILIAINLLAGLAILALLIWGTIWCINVVRRWEQRDEAKLRALQRFVANMEPKTNRSDDPHTLRAD